MARYIWFKCSCPTSVLDAVQDALDYLTLRESRQMQQQTTDALCLLDWQLGI